MILGLSLDLFSCMRFVSKVMKLASSSLIRWHKIEFQQNYGNIITESLNSITDESGSRRLLID